MNINPLTAIDFYKADHRRQYPDGTSEVYSNLTPRSSRLAMVLPEYFDNTVVFFGLQYFIKHFLIEAWNEQFFKKNKDKVVRKYKRRMDAALGKNTIDCGHIAALHDLGYLPLKIKALPEGANVRIGVPLLTIVNTKPEFFWLTNYIESVLSCYIWKSITSATTAFQYKQLFTDYSLKTGADLEAVMFQVHDFSFRGMGSLQDSALSDAAHLTSFWGTDTVAGIDLVEDYYCADAEKEPVGFSVPATEHSVMCMGEKLNELETFRRLIEDVYPSGIVSIVSDTWDFWKVVTEYVTQLKDKVLARDGKVVIRPDSGDPLKIICGDPDAEKDSPVYKGAIECLWDVFGGTLTKQGFKQLDPHVGLIYGDSITLERAKNILEGLKQKGFSSGNVVFGVGSFTYQYVTRDNFSLAMKATSGVVKSQRREIFKDPITDSGTKKSAVGLLRVEVENNNYVLYDQQTEEQEQQGELETIFEDGNLVKEVSLSNIRERLSTRLAQKFEMKGEAAVA